MDLTKFERDLKGFIGGLNCNPIPLEFSQSLSTSEFLHYLLAMVEQAINNDNSKYQEILDKFTADFKRLEQEILSKYDGSDIFRMYLDKIHDYCVTTITDLICDSLKYITFGLTDDGYFVAYIPEQWYKEISFDTCIDSTSPDYGKLAIEY